MTFCEIENTNKSKEVTASGVYTAIAKKKK